MTEEPAAYNTGPKPANEPQSPEGFTHPLRPDACACQQQRDDDVRFLAVTLRQGLKLIVTAIEKRYGLEDRRGDRAA